MVFAFGSPEGLRNSVTMGVVSAVARQPDPDSPLVYVQTDTPINPGNSGGPLVDADGELVGINTFILSSSGGNQGLGFAIPAGVVAYAYPQLLSMATSTNPKSEPFSKPSRRNWLPDCTCREISESSSPTSCPEGRRIARG